MRISTGAGLIKVRGSSCWTDRTCLWYHFETQPMLGVLVGVLIGWLIFEVLFKKKVLENLSEERMLILFIDH